ncbi:MAG: hypothetical protein ACC628_10240 [Pirellulaceae bacterium]
MRVEQALFTSACTSRMLGYHLVARSDGIRDNLARKLSPWCPTHASLLEDDLGASSLSFFAIGEEWLALARSVYGGPEYSNRGGLQIVTQILVLRREQLAGYEYNPLALARTARALGYLRLTGSPPERLPTLDLPKRTLIGQHTPPPPTRSEAEAMDQAMRRFEQKRRVALVCLKNPLDTAEQCLCRSTSRQRLEVSFTTGLKPSAHRPFRLHTFATVDVATLRRLASLGVDCIAAS